MDFFLLIFCFNLWMAGLIITAEQRSNREGTQGVRLPPPLWIFTSPPASLTKILPPLYLYNRAEFMILIWLLRTGKPWNPSSVESTTSAEDATHTLIFMIGNQGDFLAPASKHIIEYRFKPPTFLPQQPISKTSTYCIRLLRHGWRK